MSILDNGFNYTHISTNTTTAIRNGPCVLHSIVFNKPGASSNTATVYDAIAGATTVTLAVIDTTQTNIGTLLYDATLVNGLQIVTATGTAPDITVCWTPIMVTT